MILEDNVLVKVILLIWSFLTQTLFLEWKMPSIGWAWDSETKGVRWGAQPGIKGMEREIETQEKGNFKNFNN